MSARKISLPLTAASFLAALITAGLLASGAAAGGADPSDSCYVGKSKPKLPCAAAAGDSYGGYFLPDGQDSEASLEAALGYVEGEETDVTSIAHAITDDTDEFTLSHADGSNHLTWRYSGKAPLAFLTLETDQDFFSIYDISKQTDGEIRLPAELEGDLQGLEHVSFWQRTFSECEPVRAIDTHGSTQGSHGYRMRPNCQLSEIVKGTVPCVHATKQKVKTCRFRTQGKGSGQWLEGVQQGEKANYALAGQPITRKGKRRGAWVVASRATHDHEVPCRKPAPDQADKDTASAESAGTNLPASGVEEIPASTTNVTGQPLQNWATREICLSSATHPDGATLSSHVPNSNVWCFSGRGAGLNDQYGTERQTLEAPTYGTYYVDTNHTHRLLYNNAVVPAAKRPPLKPNGQPFSTPPATIKWAPYVPSATVAN